MPKPIYLVKVGMNMTEGVVEEWYIPDGAEVRAGALLYRLETEKVNLDVDAEVTGIVRHLVGEGVTLEPGAVVGYIFEPGETIPDDVAAPTAQGEASTAPAAQAIAPTAPTHSDDGRVRASPLARRLAAERGIELSRVRGTGPGGRIVEADVLEAVPSSTAAGAVDSPAETTGETSQRSSPMARKTARELGVDLAGVRGTGPGGRITREDVEAAASERSAAAGPEPSAATAPRAASAGDEMVPVRGMRRTIARRMHESLMQMAQLTMNMDVVMDDAVKLRAQLVDEWEREGLRPTYTDLVIRAVARALEQHPSMNASFTDAEIVRHGAINVGMAVALDDGLIVPVVRNADRLDMHDLVRETGRLAAAARDGTLGLDDLKDGTFTVSALGMFGVDSFTPIVNPPEVGILGVNRIREDLTWEGERPVKQQRMTLSLTWDHRALDGAPAARFLALVRDLLQAPYRLLV